MIIFITFILPSSALTKMPPPETEEASKFCWHSIKLWRRIPWV